MRRLPKDQLVVLGYLAAPPEGRRNRSETEVQRFGLELKPVIHKLVRGGLVEFETGLRRDEAGWRLTEDGWLALRLLIDGRDCAWCEEPAVDGLALRGTATIVYFCGRHREIAEHSVQGEPASRGSLAGQIRAGKIKPTTPEAVAAAQGIEP